MFVEEYLKDLRRARYRPRAVGEYVLRSVRLSVESATHRPRGLAWVAMAGLGHLVFLFLIAVILSFHVDRALAMEFLVDTGWWLLGGLLWIAFHLRMFRRDEDLPRSGLGLPNFLTLGRLLTIPAFYLFITRNHLDLALAAFLLGGLSDVLDGYAARKLNASTRMGRIFDPLVDVLFNCGIVLGLTRSGYLPGWILALALIRYGLLWFGGAWIYIARGPVAVRPTALGKGIGVLTSGLVLGVVLTVTLAPAEAADQILELLDAAIGFALLITIVQVLVIGLYNIRHAGHVPEAHGALAVVLGKRGTDEPPEEGGVAGG